MQMAKQLIEGMTTDWEPEQCNDEDHEARGARFRKNRTSKQAAPAPSKKRQATNVIDLVSVLQENLQKLKSKPAVKR
jgi:DNA end-binding protein Ku